MVLDSTADEAHCQARQLHHFLATPAWPTIHHHQQQQQQQYI